VTKNARVKKRSSANDIPNLNNELSIKPAAIRSKEKTNEKNKYRKAFFNGGLT